MIFLVTMIYFEIQNHNELKKRSKERVRLQHWHGLIYLINSTLTLMIFLVAMVILQSQFKYQSKNKITRVRVILMRFYDLFCDSESKKIS